MVRSNVAQDKPYTGLTEIKSGEVAEDLAAYLADSEQTNSALALGVSISRDASVRAAGGYLLQANAPACLRAVLPFMRSLEGWLKYSRGVLALYIHTHLAWWCLTLMAAKCLV